MNFKESNLQQEEIDNLFKPLMEEKKEEPRPIPRRRKSDRLIIDFRLDRTTKDTYVCETHNTKMGVNYLFYSGRRRRALHCEGCGSYVPVPEDD